MKEAVAKVYSPSELCAKLGVKPAGVYQSGSTNYGSRATKITDYCENDLGCAIQKSKNGIRTGLWITDDQMFQLEDFVSSWNSKSDECDASDCDTASTILTQILKESIKTNEYLAKLCESL